MLRNSVPLHYDMMSWGPGGGAPRILDESIILTLVDSLPPKRESRYSLYGRPCGPKSRLVSMENRSEFFAKEVWRIRWAVLMVTCDSYPGNEAAYGL